MPAEATISPPALRRAIPFSSPGRDQIVERGFQPFLGKDSETTLRPKHNAERGGNVLGPVDQLRPCGAAHTEMLGRLPRQHQDPCGRSNP